MSDFKNWAERAGILRSPYDWQTALAVTSTCQNQLIRIPTGFGKTLGVLAAWLFNRVGRRDPDWPRRLVWCLPMRVLVEQTEQVAREALSLAGLLWETGQPHEGRVGVHLLMGGRDQDPWYLYPEAEAVLVGTQDMLLSRALNRGYAAPRARWPMEYGLLHSDALWVFDEVQLMDAGLSTSAQLQAFRDQDRPKALRPCATWWMSATLQKSWLTSVDTATMLEGAPSFEIAPPQRIGHLWTDVSKPCAVNKVSDTKAVAGLSADLFRERGGARLSLVVLNTVDRAVQTHEELKKALGKDVDLRLVHSRFRAHERAKWQQEFLHRDSPVPEQGRIIVATQVVEAGVDIDAANLVTELAPWPSLVQRFGRAARRGGDAVVRVVDFGLDSDDAAAPYAAAELAGARRALSDVRDVSPLRLEQFEAALDAPTLAGLYPYEPEHLLIRNEFDELFDTTPDLSGADIDISRFIRSGDERDVHVFWREVEGQPEPELQPSRDELCNVPFVRAREWLCATKSELAPGKQAWVWDYLDGVWTRAKRALVLPGQVVLVNSKCGGYSSNLGWAPSSKQRVPPVGKSATPRPEDVADQAESGEQLSANLWKTVGTHGNEARVEVARICEGLGLTGTIRRILELAALWHDVGKSHPVFQGSIRIDGRPARSDIAKAPPEAWSRRALYLTADDRERRPGFRHELASALAMLELVRKNDPEHEGVLGPWLEVLDALGGRQVSGPKSTAGGPEAELVALSGPDLDLVLYLVASHHGKVRCSLDASPLDQEYRDRDGRGLPIRGVREGDQLPDLAFADGRQLEGVELTLEPARLGLSHKTGASWSERVLVLLRRHGPETLGFLEACLRAADIWASRLTAADGLIAAEERQ